MKNQTKTFQIMDKLIIENIGEIQKGITKYKPFMNKMRVEMSNSMFVKAIYQRVDEVNEKYINDKISCHRGCSYCCHDEIRMTKFESDYLKDYIFSNKIKPNRRLLKKQNRHPYSLLSFNDKKCSLLKNGECQVYEARPLICRIYNSTADPLLCINPKNTPTVRSIDVLAIMATLIDIDIEVNKSNNEYLIHKILKE